MIDEDDIDLFRNTVESQKPFDKDLKKSLKKYVVSFKGRKSALLKNTFGKAYLIFPANLLLAVAEKNHNLLSITLNLNLFLFLIVSIWKRRRVIA